MRWKLVIAFGSGFTVIFAAVAIWILRFSVDTANDRIESTLRSVAVGGATTIDAAAFEVLLADLSAEVEPGSPYPATAGTLAGRTSSAAVGYPADLRYWDHVNELADIRRTNPDASPYTYYLSPSGELQFVGSWGALGYPTMGIGEPEGGRFKQDVRELIDDVTEDYFRQGLEATTAQPAYSDAIDEWISVYTPIANSDGRVIGALGVDYPLSYVDDVRARVGRVLYPVFAVTYLVLLVFVYHLSGRLTRRLTRLTSASTRIAEGDYDVDVSSTASARYGDEMTELAAAFSTMAKRVGARERSLVQQMASMKVEIDGAKRERAVAEIVDTDFFANLSARAAEMRRRAK
jgi:HAMP domain-containing protein